MSIRNNRGMTLTEIMIVLIIVGVIATLAGNKAFENYKKSQVKETKIMMANLGQTIQMYAAECNKLPPTLEALVTSPGEDVCPNWQGPYEKKMPKDAWGNAFIYEVDNSDYVIKSLGADGREGGTKYDKDLSTDDE